MDENKMVPQLRFKGFTDDWKQRKLGDFNVKTGPFGSTLHADDYVEDGTPIVTTEHFKTGDLPESKTGIPQVCAEDVKRLKQYELREHDIVFSRVGSVDLNAEVLKNHVGWLFSGRVLRVRPDDTIDSSFLHYELGTDQVRSSIIERAVGLTMASINTRILEETSFFSPQSKREQSAIGSYFRQLDKLITLHQRKYEKLLALKKSMLDKMFPQTGSDVPEIRFAGFAGAWEQRKLASLCEKFTDGDWIESKDQSDSGVRLVQTGNVGVTEYLDKSNNKKWISADTFDRLHCEEVLPGDILISRLPEPAGRACIMPFLGTKMITAVDCTIVRTAPDVSNKFLVQYLSSQAYFDEVNTCLAGGTRQRISRSNLANFDVSIPAEKPEQDAIGTFFGHLDNLITLHQRKYEKLKQIKQSMLEKMFV